MRCYLDDQRDMKSLLQPVVSPGPVTISSVHFASCHSRAGGTIQASDESGPLGDDGALMDE